MSVIFYYLKALLDYEAVKKRLITLFLATNENDKSKTNDQKDQNDQNDQHNDECTFVWSFTYFEAKTEK